MILLLTAKNDHERIVKSLLNAGADNSLRIEKEKTALYITAERRYISIVKLLFNSGLESSTES
jgi:ankyrin repeat protein